MSIRILLINTNAAICSIHEFGKLVYNSLCYNKNWSIDYIETKNLNIEAFYKGKVIINGNEVPPYNIYLFNYHDVMRFKEGVDHLRFLDGFGIKISFILEMFENNPVIKQIYAVNKFDKYIVIDPTMKYPDNRYCAFHKPMYRNPNLQITHQENEIPMIGSFGFGFDSSKGFESIIKAVNDEFNEAIIRINLPQYTYGDNNPTEYLNFKLNCECIAKSGIQVKITRNLFTNDELITWCSQHDLNVFLYNRLAAGLASATDQAIMSGRPIAISDCRSAFRHILDYQQSYPNISLKDTIKYGKSAVELMNRDWSIEQFQYKFERLLNEVGL